MGLAVTPCKDRKHESTIHNLAKWRCALKLCYFMTFKSLTSQTNVSVKRPPRPSFSCNPCARTSVTRQQTSRMIETWRLKVRGMITAKRLCVYTVLWWRPLIFISSSTSVQPHSLMSCILEVRRLANFPSCIIPDISSTTELKSRRRL